ncbi:MoxR-related ATPase, AAA superfamily [Thermogladius calderae 1633]|uniref:MoxR-related ATPase, AAA superfamily n=1 Tax=Thermogladius calderae (strain DSM 22663 / VKM B-2946 / 1633) TaxID=1184251 RepID=I3TEB1_THEC1|nr:MoxR family ATPase [Thermogladius calderae]AFK51099.1 MoxR-related ATPase, AAA superfamily [Thermogladius calderae 1633]
MGVRQAYSYITGSGYLIEKEREVKLVLAALIARGHVLIEGVPGVAKTTIAKTIARTLSLDFKRVQMTPDLLPMDIIGYKIFDQKTAEFKFVKGPIFTNILLADEINRASPRTQSALLEAMQERQVTIEGETFRLDEPFIVLATQNPIEMEGVFPLPEAQLDRFLVKIETGYPSTKGFVEMLKKVDEIEAWVEAIKPVVTKEEVLNEIKSARDVKVDEAIYQYIANLVEETRRHHAVRLGASPRSGIAILRMAKAVAYLEGRNYVIPDDVKQVLVPTLSHRIILKPEYEVEGLTASRVVEEIANRVPVPRP